MSAKVLLMTYWQRKGLNLWPSQSQSPCYEFCCLPLSYALRGYLLHLLVSHRSHNTEPGLVLTLGQGDVGQLGLGESVLERKKPALVPLLQDVVQAEAGGMHTVCLCQSGQVG